MKAYFLPGLGFDTRIFEKLDLPGVERINLEWIEPLPDEPFAAYVKRMAANIPETKEPLLLVGHSMGGMAAQEVACIRKVRQVILVSSIRSRAELPGFFRMVRPLGIHWLFTKRLTRWTFPFWGKRHGYVTLEERELFLSMIQRKSNRYFRWALKALSSWKTPDIPKETVVFQIHGEKDQTFPSHLIDEADHKVAGCGHFMVYKEPAKISKLLLEAWDLPSPNSSFKNPGRRSNSSNNDQAE